jgi:hypothetical protein
MTAAALPMADEHPKTDQHVAGEIRVVAPRRVWVARSRGEIWCLPDPREGHRIKDPLVWEHGCLRCTYKVGRGDAMCGRLVYLVGGGLVNPRGESLVILAEVSPADWLAMDKAKMDHDAALKFLGIRFPG